ncbi:MAG: SAM-dependent methyltransferase [Candidatus Korarchaeum sp.]|nr:SAM-dependent methyltransferase [Candidatus Korarchaeum sp.]MDW8036045.1 N-6 DNA methylase [Candidatus Korarchaeum sp.]
MNSTRAEVLRKLGISPLNDDCFEILATSLKYLLKYDNSLESLVDWDAPVLPKLSRLGAEEMRLIESEVERTKVTLKECQIRVQRLIPSDIRKRFSAYYTSDLGREVIASLSSELLGCKEATVLADPFLGSGSLLTSAIERIGGEKVEYVWGVEPLPLPALVAYASLVDSLRGRKGSVKVLVGDSFELVPEFLPQELLKADAVLTNPPFTRWRNLESSYRERLISLSIELGYGTYLTRREVSLQVISMFLCDHILNEKGSLISVIPASTLYTIYGKGIRRLLRERYAVHKLVSSKLNSSFSEGSEFKEVIIAATKGGSWVETAFIELSEQSADAVYTLVDLRNLPRFLDINWLVFLADKGLREMLNEVLEEGLTRGSLKYGSELLDGRMVRGIEMYGPDFFFLPNRFWSIIEEEEDHLRIAGGGKELSISKEFLVRALRKPSFYAKIIKAEANSFMLSIPSLDVHELPQELRCYVEWGLKSGAVGPALRSKGRRWYSHVWKQIAAKEPYGRVFLPDKVDISFRGRSVFANYSEEEVAASKDFYIIRGVSEIAAKILVGWFNSTIFLYVLALLGRKISNTWTRFLENDYFELPILNFSDARNFKVVESVDRMLKLELPPIWDQIGESYRYELDLAVAEFIGLEEPEGFIEHLYESTHAILVLKSPK